MLERVSVGCVIVTFCLLVACNESPIFPTLQMATVQLSSAPDPVVAVPSSGVTYEVDGQVLVQRFGQAVTPARGGGRAVHQLHIFAQRYGGAGAVDLTGGGDQHD